MPPPQLNYAPRPPLHRRRIPASVWIGTALVVFLACTPIWVPTYWARIKLLYWQRQCMNHSFPDNQVVFDSKAPGAVKSPRAWTGFYDCLLPDGFRSVGTIFVHRMKTPQGSDRLVAVDVIARPPGLRPPFEVMSRVFRPGTMTRPAHESGGGAVDAPPEERPRSFRILAGQIDRADPTHMTFSAVQGKKTIVYDGWLQSTGGMEIHPR